MVKFGIAGLGFMGATHVGALQKIPGVELAAVCTTNERALTGDLTEVGGNLDIPTARYDFSSLQKCRDWRELVSNPELDAIDICLPTDLHPDVAVAALQSGKHVFCEKPMALDTIGCKRMIDAACEAGRVLMVGQVLRFWPEYEFLRDAIKQQIYGPVWRLQFRRTAGLPDWSRWLAKEERSGGAVIDLLVHDIDQAIAVFGMPERVSAAPLGPVDTIEARLFYPNGVQVEIKGGWLPAGEPFSMGFEMQAEQGTLKFGADGLVFEREPGSQPVSVSAGDGYQRELSYFVECCRTGAKTERCPPEQSAQGIALALLLKESRSKGGETLACSG